MKFLLILVIVGEALIRRTIRFRTIAEETHPYDMYFPEISENGMDVQSARAVLLSTQCYPQIQYIHEMTLEQRQALHVIDNNFITKKILRRHRAWHSNMLNSVGGITGPGSGIALGGKHGLMLKEMEIFVGVNWKRPKLDRSRMLDVESQMDIKFTPVGSRGTNFPNYYKTPFPQRDNFLTADDWWRYKGLHDHAQFHQRVGGIMADNKNSPTDVFAFFGHHATLQREFEEWCDLEIKQCQPCFIYWF